jgi:tartrate-resistant acid phosphatase type 5
MRITSALTLALLLISAPLLTAQNPAPVPGTSNLNFLVISDWGAKASTTQVAVARAMGRIAAAQGTRLVVTCGDNYHSDGIDKADSPRWKAEFEDVYSSPALQVPWYPSLGNHDNRGKVQAEIDYSKLSPRWKLPARYYAHREPIGGSNEVLFVHLDTSPFVKAYRKNGSSYKVQDQDPQAQLRWLDTVLSESQARWKIVVGHHPIYAAATTHGDTQELIEDVLPVLQRHGVRIYFCGHDHVLQHLVHDNLNFFVCGGGSSHRAVNQRADVRFGAPSAGFLSMTLTPTAAEACYFNEKGKELYRVTIPN